jgi:UDP-N-acetylmuramoyl-tripeptide--D-alanyl-D-alanine ligase
MMLSELAQLLNINASVESIQYNNISSDTRHLKPGDVYIAFSGARYDGHKFLQQAEAAGAIACITQQPAELGIPVFQVPDARQAYMHIAAVHRQRMSARVIAVTGSCGKTTTRTLLQGIFSQAAPTHASVASYNNEIGVPYTLLGLKPEHQFLIAEIGTNAPGEIKMLADIVCPELAIITNVAAAHLEGFKDMQHYVAEKSDIIASTTADGCVVLNADDPHFDHWCRCAGERRVVSFSCVQSADMVAENITLDEQGCARFDISVLGLSISLRLMGRHNVANALAAAAAASAMGLTPEQIKSGLECVLPESKRLVIQPGAGSVRIINDTYNANPLSTRAAIDVLCSLPGHRVFVFADMGELGDQSAQMHQMIGRYASTSGVSHFFTYGELAKNAADAFGVAAQHFSQQDELVAALKQRLNAESVVLIKGSRAMKMERVVEALQE